MSRLDPRLLLQGYATGIFPMADSRDADELFWVEPRNRAIIPLDRFHLSRSLRRTLRSGRFLVTHDRDFAGVIAACAEREETWINAELEHAMIALQGSGHAHSIEVFEGDELVGGLYGVKLGRAFFGESMFSRRTRCVKGRARVARRTAQGWQFHPSRLPVHDRASRLIGRGQHRRARLTSHCSSAALGGGVAAGGAAAALVAGLGRRATRRRTSLALDRLLEIAGAAGAAGPAGYVIAQLLGQTS